MKSCIQVFPGAVSVQKCNEIIRRGMQLIPQDASIGFDNDRTDSSYRVSTIRWFYYRDNKDISDLLLSYAQEANRESFGLDIFNNAYDMQFTEYHATNKGKYDWHHDVWWVNPRAHDRKLSIVIQLTDPQSYEGGCFEFNAPEISNNELIPFKQQGSVLVFPSFFYHRVTPVTAGTRYSLVSWIDGPKFR